MCCDITRQRNRSPSRRKTRSGSLQTCFFYLLYTLKIINNSTLTIKVKEFDKQKQPNWWHRGSSRSISKIFGALDLTQILTNIVHSIKTEMAK